MLDLTVSVDLFHPASAFYWGLWNTTFCRIDSFVI